MIYEKCLIRIQVRSVTHKTGEFKVSGVINAITRP